MSEERAQTEQHEPKGLGEHTRGVAAEWAHEQGWGLNEEERTRNPEGRPQFYGGKGYDYGAAQDFGDEAVKRDAGEGAGDESSTDQ